MHNMAPDLKEQLLLRLFSSIEYSEQFAEHFIQFIDTGLLALEHYDALPVKPTTAANYNEVKKDADLWHLKVKPNFLGMREGILEAIEKARNGDFSYISSDAANLRGLSRDMDGIREAFMDFIEPEIKQRYFELWKIARTEGNNIYLTISNYWDVGQILDEEITGPINEQLLLQYLKPDEQV